MPRIAVVVGTRPQIIKSAPVIRKLSGRRRFQLSLIHTGQHYDYELSKVFFNEMRLPNPDVNLGVGSDTPVRQTAAIMIALERVLVDLSPDIVLVPGDTNSALASALVAAKLKIPLAHLEAGPRQFDLSNPEEANRIVVDHLSTVGFAPTRSSYENLRREGFESRRIRLSGDTMLDCLIEHTHSLSTRQATADLGVEGDYFFVTIHREENTDDSLRLAKIVQALVSAGDYRFIFPVHPRTKKCLKHFGLWKELRAAKHIGLSRPLNYERNLAAVSRSVGVLTDSGGLQKEAFWLGVPCVTIFKSTPWPETLREGANRCIEPDGSSFLTALSDTESVRVDRKRSYSMFGNGKASEKVCRVLMEMHDS